MRQAEILADLKESRFIKDRAKGSSGWLQSNLILRSGVVTIVVVALGLLVAAITWQAHTRGRFAKLKQELNPAEHVTLSPQPGGQDALVVERSSIEGGTVPEFLSATVLPGRGMNVLQIKALLPSKGEVNLLASPTLEDAAKSMNGKDDDTNGAASLTMGGAFEVPWAGDLYGAPSDGDRMSASWNGYNLRLPAERRGAYAVATGGLLLKKDSFSSDINMMPDGGEIAAVYDLDSSDGSWPSKMKVDGSIQLSSRTIEMKIVATNTGTVPEPVGMGWRPRFALLSDRGKIMLRLPSVTREEIRDTHSGIPSGRLVAVEGTEYDFSSRTGSELGNLSLDDTFVHLRQAPLDAGPVAELRDPDNNYGIRLTMLSTSIRAIHVDAPSDGGFVTMEPRFNYDDPFGHQWSRDEHTGMVVLEPGKSVQWRVRLEIFALTPATSSTNSSHS